MKGLVCDASPLIILAKADLLFVLPKLSSEIIAPYAVRAEILKGRATDPMRLALPECRWLRFITLDPPLTRAATSPLGAGESESIELARRHPNWTVVLDDRAGRRYAAEMGVPVIGTLSIIARAAKEKYVSSFDEAVERLHGAGLYVSNSVIERVRNELESGDK